MGKFLGAPFRESLLVILKAKIRFHGGSPKAMLNVFQRPPKSGREIGAAKIVKKCRKICLTLSDDFWLCFLSKVPEGHHPRGTTLAEALRGNLPLGGLCRGLSEGSAGSLRGFCGVSAGLCGGPRDFPRVFKDSDPMLDNFLTWPLSTGPFCGPLSFANHILTACGGQPPRDHTLT